MSRAVPGPGFGPAPASARYLLQLERSQASVMGLVSFPVELVYICRTGKLAAGKGVAEVPLPQIDLPIAYAWCEAFVPQDVTAREWAGPLRRVDQFSSQTAKARLDYGAGELAAGYLAANRPIVRAPAVGDTPPLTEAPNAKRSAPIRHELLARNYFWAGKDYYEKGDYDKAAANLKKVRELAPDSVEGENAARLLANKESLEGGFKYQSKGQKAAAAEVQKEVSERLSSTLKLQKDLLYKSRQAEQAGQTSQARATLEAAQALNAKLKPLEQASGGRGGGQNEEAIQKRLENLKQSEQSELRKQFEDHKKSGDQSKAFDVGQRLRDVGGEDEKLRKELDRLAIASKPTAPSSTPSRVSPDPAKSAPTSQPDGTLVTRVYDIGGLRTANQPNDDSTIRALHENVDPQSWRWGGAVVRDGKLTVTQTPENQKAVADLLTRLEKARGPQVATGGTLALQGQGGSAAAGNNTFTGGTLITGESTSTLTPEGSAGTTDTAELNRFIARNYATGGPNHGTDRFWSGGGMQTDLSNSSVAAEALRKLDVNRGQKVVVNSRNLSLSNDAAASMGIQFETNANGLTSAIIDEAQFRSLAELDAAGRGVGHGVGANDTLQETIVGTDARLANGWSGNVRHAGEDKNTLYVNGNAVTLPHDRYLLIGNGSYVTAVRAGPMQFWTEKPADVQFYEVPQTIDVPRVGQAVRLEKTLLDPTDRLVLRLTYTANAKGDSQ